MDTPEPEKIPDLIKKMDEFVNVGYGDRAQRPLMARIHAIISREQAQSAAKLERQTSTLIRLTWAIAILTAVLLFFTIVLYKDAHAQIQHDKLTEHAAAQQ
jgi:hypothetical protein